MSRRLLAVLGIAAVCSAVAVPAHAAQRSACQRLSGVDRAPDRNVKLVKRPSRERPLADGSRASELVGCLLPRGRIFTIATRKGVENDLAEEFGFRVRQVAGRVVLLDTFGTEGGYGSLTETMVWNLGTGGSYTIARRCFGKDVPCSAEYDDALRALVTRDGRAVAMLAHWTANTSSGTHLVASYTSAGTPRLLDAGPPADLPAPSLALTGSTASWTHAGQPRSIGL